MNARTGTKSAGPHNGAMRRRGVGQATPSINAPRKAAHKRSATSRELEAKWLVAKRGKAKERRPSFLVSDQQIQGPELYRALDFVFQATGDPLFMDARDVLKSYGLDRRLKESAPRVYDDIMGHPEIAWYERMHAWIRGHSACANPERLVTEAAEILCADPSFPQGSSFDSDRQRLSRGYSRWVTGGCKPQQSTKDGMFGRQVWVVPRNGEPLKLGSFHVPAGGAVRPYDLFLRRLFLDGVIMIAKHG